MQKLVKWNLVLSGLTLSREKRGNLINVCVCGGVLGLAVSLPEDSE